jgi:ABC-type lipoprotein release transport system permease subunit
MASTAALVIVLSVFNGLQEFVISNYNRFNPPLKIEAKEGKVFDISHVSYLISHINNIEGVKAVEPVLSDLALITYNDKQTFAQLYGVSEQYPVLSGLELTTIDGEFYTDTENGAVFGAGIAGFLGIELHNYIPAKIYYPKRNKKSFVNPMEAFQKNYAFPIGVFASNTSYDENALFIPVAFAKKILDYDTEISYLAIFLDDHATIKKVQTKIIQIMGDGFTVQNQIQQEALLFKIIQGENIIVYIILGFIFIIATFNITGILGMLIVEKKQDISILYTLGASKALLKKVFLFVGAMIGIFGGFFGICIGLICCFVQQYFGIITLGNSESTFFINAYPVSIYFKDFVVVFFLIIFITLLTSGFSLRGLKNSELKNKY